MSDVAFWWAALLLDKPDAQTVNGQLTAYVWPLLFIAYFIKRLAEGVEKIKENSTLLSLPRYNSHCSFPLPQYYRTVFTSPAVLPYICPHYHGNYRGYRVVTAVPITVSLSSAGVLQNHFAETKNGFGKHLEIYTDGSKTGEAIACAVISGN